MLNYRIYAHLEGRLAAWIVQAESYEKAIELVKEETQITSAILCLLEENAT